MPELPDLTVYLEHIERRARGQVLRRLRIGNPFVLRSVAPAPAEFEGRTLRGTSRSGKRLILEFEGAHFAVIHLMVLGRLQWKETSAALPRNVLASFDFERGSLQLTESGSKRRASLHLVAGAAALREFDRGGLEVAGASFEQFRERLRRDNHTLKRALTDPAVFAAIGNAYSDEILHRAKLSPFLHSQRLDDAQERALFEAARDVLAEWTARLRQQAGEQWPKKVTAFHEEMAVHGRFRKPCPVCGAPVQRIVYKSNEANYCARCQTGGRLLADRALSRLLHDSWPKTIE
jgi:formamidopyrimidine-DNA glycosylase